MLRILHEADVTEAVSDTELLIKLKRRQVAITMVDKPTDKIFMRPDAMEGISTSKWLSRKKRRLVAANVVEKAAVKIIFKANTRPDAMEDSKSKRRLIANKLVDNPTDTIIFKATMRPLAIEKATKSKWFSKVVLPAPKKPVITVTGIVLGASNGCVIHPFLAHNRPSAKPYQHQQATRRWLVLGIFNTSQV